MTKTKEQWNRYWEFCKKIAKEVSTWPAWKRKVAASPYCNAPVMCVEPEDPPVKEQTFPKEPESTPEVKEWCRWYSGMMYRHAADYTRLANLIEIDPSYRDDLVGETRVKAIAELRGQANQCESIAIDLTFRHEYPS